MARSTSIDGSSVFESSSTAAIYIAVGKVSLEDWPRFTSSFGLIGFLEPSTPPAIWMARLAMTSLAFMLLCVPDPVWNTTRGNSWSHVPAMTSSAAWMMSATFSGGSSPSSPFASAAAFLRMPKARMTGRVQAKRPMPMGKLWMERSVCAPHRRSPGTGTSPSASCSIRNPVVGVVSVIVRSF